jgi:aryl-alcohol dehydrogenase-like predicted oxidoreductase
VLRAATAAALQAQFSLLDRRPLNGMLARCTAAGMKLLTYGSVGGGLLSDKFVEQPKKGLFGACGRAAAACLDNRDTSAAVPPSRRM